MQFSCTDWLVDLLSIKKRELTKAMKLRFVLMVFIDMLIGIAAYYSALAFLLTNMAKPVEGNFEDPLSIGAILFIGVALLVSYLMEVYTLDRRCKKWKIFINCLRAGGGIFFTLLLVSYLSELVGNTRWVFLLASGLFFTYQFLWHAFSAFAVQSPRFCQRVLILGVGSLARQLGEMICTDNRLFNLAGFIKCSNNESDGERTITEELLVPMDTDLLSTARKVKADIIVVAIAEKRGVLPLQQMMQCKLEGIQVVDAPTFYEINMEKLMLEEITPGWIVFSNGFNRSKRINIYKRCFDVALSTIGLFLSIPLLPIIAVAIAFDSAGPVFFQQVRVGNGEKTFTLYKFRSMTLDAEKNGAVWAMKNDVRVTRVGRFLRDYRIDEIPQLYNVFMGDMSFIGPRPERPEFVQSLKKDIFYYSKRHTIKPGITGWAQVRYPYGATVEDAIEKLRYDLYYIKNLSFSLDSQILFETMKLVILGKGGR